VSVKFGRLSKESELLWREKWKDLKVQSWKSRGKGMELKWRLMESAWKWKKLSKGREAGIGIGRGLFLVLAKMFRMSQDCLYSPRPILKFISRCDEDPQKTEISEAGQRFQSWSGLWCYCRCSCKGNTVTGIPSPIFSHAFLHIRPGTHTWHFRSVKPPSFFEINGTSSLALALESLSLLKSKDGGWNT